MSAIERIELVEFDHTIRYGYSAAGESVPGSVRTNRRFGVRLYGVDGCHGSYVVLWSAPPMAVAQVKAMASSIIGLDMHDRELIWDRLNTVFGKTDRIGGGVFDIALWDALGHEAGLPIATLLGRYRDRLPVYVSTVDGGRGLGSLASPSSYRDFARSCADRGVPAFKVHAPAGGEVSVEIATLRAAAEGAGDRMKVMTDPTMSLATLADALELGRACDDVGAYWWEDPMRGCPPHGHKILRERVRTPLLVTEMVRGLDARMAVALAGATDYLRADPELDLGITGVMKTAHAAESIGIDVELHASGPAQRQCIAAIRNTNFYELGLLDPTTGNVLHPDVYRGDYSEELDAVGADGCVAVPSGPGLGVEYDWERIMTQNADAMTIR